MSSSAMEKALWQAISNPAEGQRLREDPQSYLGDFRLDENERAMILSWDVKAMAGHGVSELLLMMAYSAINGMDKLPEYIGRINA